MPLRVLLNRGQCVPLPLLVTFALFWRLLPVSGFDATLEGKANHSTVWTTDTLTDYIELDRIKCRVRFEDGPASSQTFVLQFDHSAGLIPCLQDLTNFSTSGNVIITAGPTLSAPVGADTWSYSFTVDVKDDKEGYVEFQTRLASGAHLIDSDSLHIKGSDSLGTLRISRPDKGGGVCDLVVSKLGPATAAPGDIITYTLSYSNKVSAPKGADRAQLNDILPPEVTYVPGSATAGGTIVGNTLTWDLPDHLDEGQAGSVSYKVRVNPNPVYGQSFDNLVQIYSSEDDADYSDNSYTFTTSIAFSRPPVANSDNYGVNEDEVLIIPAPGVLANDPDPDGDPLTALLVQGPNHGALTLNPDGSFSYVPVLDYNGPDSFIYKASDGSLTSAVAIVTLTIVPVNDPPVANNDNYATDENKALAVSAPGVLANDTDVERDSFGALLLTAPSHGSIEFDFDGSFTYRPTTNYYGTDSFGYQATDGVSESQPGTVTITVRRVNRPPAVSVINPTNGTFYFAPADVVIVADAYDSDGTVSKVDFFNGTNLLAQTNLGAHFIVWTNVASGTNQLFAKATDNDGASAMSAPVNITVLERPPFLTLQGVHFNPQTGLFEEIVRISNPSQKAIDGVRVLVTNLRPGVALFNSSGKTNGISFVQTLLPIPAGGSVDLRIEYYVPNSQAPDPTLAMEVVPPAEPVPAPSGTFVPVTRRLRMEDGSFLIEFNSVAGRLYFVTYSEDMTTWKTAWPTIIGTGTRSQWVDNGPPRTECLPPAAGSRFYRVVLAP